MRTISLLCVLSLSAVSVAAQNPAAVPPQSTAPARAPGVAPATAPNAATDSKSGAATSSILETGLLIVSRDWSSDLQSSAPQAQAQLTFSLPPSPQGPPGFQWREAMRQWSMFLTWQHSVRLFQEKTHSQLGGSFWEDYVRSVRGLHGWWDGDSRTTNFLGHPMMGAISGYIQVQNDPAAHFVKIGRDAAYWRSRGKALAAAAVYSTQFELGPASEASIGNVGQKPGTMAWVDLLVTPLAGVGMIVAEDAIDRFVIAKAEARLSRNNTRLLRTVLNPNRSIANIIRFQAPWHRDSRGVVSKDGPRASGPDAAGRDGAVAGR